jgi:hypothetical protein
MKRNPPTKLPTAAAATNPSAKFSLTAFCMSLLSFAMLPGAAMALVALSAPHATAQAGPSQQSQPAQSSSGQSSPDNSSMPGMDMDDMRGTATPNSAAGQAAQSATQAMSNQVSNQMSGGNMSDDMHMSAHMRMTSLRPANPADQRRADAIVATLRQSIAQYEDYHAALADGFHIFAPNVPQKIYHFTSGANAVRAQFTFDPARPTSLLYRKTSTGYVLVGAMYTAPRRFTDDQLNSRVPLSVARWHEHVDFCLPPRGTAIRDANWKQFGLEGSISTEDACRAAGGRWFPIVFGWMVHVYPFESDPAKTWAH